MTLPINQIYAQDSDNTNPEPAKTEPTTPEPPAQPAPANTAGFIQDLGNFLQLFNTTPGTNPTITQPGDSPDASRFNVVAKSQPAADDKPSQGNWGIFSFLFDWFGGGQHSSSQTDALAPVTPVNPPPAIPPTGVIPPSNTPPLLNIGGVQQPDPLINSGQLPSLVRDFLFTACSAFGHNDCDTQVPKAIQGSRQPTPATGQTGCRSAAECAAIQGFAGLGRPAKGDREMTYEELKQKIDQPSCDHDCRYKAIADALDTCRSDVCTNTFQPMLDQESGGTGTARGVNYYNLNNNVLPNCTSLACFDLTKQQVTGECQGDAQCLKDLDAYFSKAKADYKQNGHFTPPAITPVNNDKLNKTLSSCGDEECIRTAFGSAANDCKGNSSCLQKLSDYQAQVTQDFRQNGHITISAISPTDPSRNTTLNNALAACKDQVCINAAFDDARPACGSNQSCKQSLNKYHEQINADFAKNGKVTIVNPPVTRAATPPVPKPPIKSEEELAVEQAQNQLNTDTGLLDQANQEYLSADSRVGPAIKDRQQSITNYFKARDALDEVRFEDPSSEAYRQAKINVDKAGEAWVKTYHNLYDAYNARASADANKSSLYDRVEQDKQALEAAQAKLAAKKT